MHYVTRYPLFWSAIAIATGIAICNFITITIYIAISLATVMIACWVLLFYFFKPAFFLSLYATICIALGITAACYFHVPAPKLPYEEILAYKAKIIGEVQSGTKWNKCIVQSQSLLLANEKWIPFNTQIQLFYPSQNKNLEYGQELLVYGSPRFADTSTFKWQFDYKNYLANKNIYLLQYTKNIKSGTIHWSNFIIGSALTAREYASDKLSSLIPDEKTKAIAIALVLGKKDLLTPEISQQFAKVGALHALAVSGAHLMILVEIIMLALRNRDKDKTGRIKPSIAIFLTVLIWSYAFITGWSGSVLRAAIMFTFTIIGRLSKKNIPPLNSLGGSACILLLINPTILFDAGFQLSIMAVFGIIIISPSLEKLWKPKLKPLKFLWQITVIALAANLGTLILSAYYFHQIPTFFLIANLFIVPLTELALCSGILTVVFSSIPYVNQIAAWFTSFIIDTNTYLLSLINSLPYLNLFEVELSVLDVILFYAMIFCTIASVIYKRLIYLYAGALFTCLVQVHITYSDFKINLEAGNTLLYYQNELVSVHKNQILKSSFNPADSNKTDTGNLIPINSGIDILQFYSSQILIISSKEGWQKLHFTQNPSPHYVWFQGVLPYNLAKQSWLHKSTILASNLGSKSIQQLKSQADSLHIPCIALKSPMLIPEIPEHNSK